MTCEKCSAIFSRKKCLHEKCPSHRAEVAAFQKKIDNHIHKMIVQAWYSRDKAPEVQPPHETENNIVVSRIQSPKHHHHSAQTSGVMHFPGKNEAVGDSISPRNHQQTFSAPTAPPNDKAPGILLSAQPPIVSLLRALL